MKKPDVVRYYMIHLDNVHQLRNVTRASILFQRPTPWKIFLLSFFRIRTEYGFVFLPESHVRRFLGGLIPVSVVNDKLKINGDTYRIEPWNTWNCAKFCIDGFQYGTFTNLSRWTWS